MTRPIIHPTAEFDLNEIKKRLLGSKDIGDDKVVLVDNLALEKITIKEDDEKKLFTYNQSLERLRSDGYERHLRPGEAFNIIIKNLEDKEIKEGKYKEIYKDMLSSYGEWLSLALGRKNDILICYLDPEEIIFENDSYNTVKFNYQSKNSFYIGDGVLSNEWVNLKEFPEELSQFLFSMNFNELPDKMKKGDNEIRLYLPEEGIWPVVYESIENAFNVIKYERYAGSRGLRRYVRQNNN